MAAKRPYFKFPPNAPETSPTNVGPPEHPRSPASASRANMEVPPFGHPKADMLKVPGHIIPTESPQSPHPSSANIGADIREAVR